MAGFSVNETNGLNAHILFLAILGAVCCYAASLALEQLSVAFSVVQGTLIPATAHPSLVGLPLSHRLYVNQLGLVELEGLEELFPDHTGLFLPTDFSGQVPNTSPHMQPGFLHLFPNMRGSHDPAVQITADVFPAGHWVFGIR